MTDWKDHLLFVIGIPIPQVPVNPSKQVLVGVRLRAVTRLHFGRPAEFVEMEVHRAYGQRGSDLLRGRRRRVEAGSTHGERETFRVSNSWDPHFERMDFSVMKKHLGKLIACN